MEKRQPSHSKRRFFFLCAGLVLSLLVVALPFGAKAAVFNAKSFTLENGLQVIVVSNHRAPIVTHMVWYKVGAADEPQGLSGMAHYFEHLMFKGTKTMAPGAFSRTVKRLGGRDNAFTSQDYTAYFQTISVQHLERMMEMEADRMVNLSVPAEHFASEKSVVLEERRQRTENNPRRLFMEQMNSALFTNHPYGTPVIGWMNEIESYEWDDVKKFYDTWYAPNNAIVVISGDITIDDVKPMAERTYGKLKPKTLPTRQEFKIPDALGSTEMTLRDPSIQQQFYQKTRLAPGYKKNVKDALSLQVLEQILSGGPTTRLYKNLVIDQKKAVSVNLSYSPNSLSYSTIDLSATPANGVFLKEIETLVDQEINKVIEHGVTETEVRDAIQRLQDQASFARDSVRGPAMIIGLALTTGSTLENIENWPDLIGKVTTNDVQNVAKKYLDNKAPWIRPSVTGYFLPPLLENKEEEKE